MSIIINMLPEFLEGFVVGLVAIATFVIVQKMLR